MTQKSASGGAEDQASEVGQREVIAFLSDPATHSGEAVEQVDTHISRIFLTDDRAFKLKRAVRTNYLDFSTLALRERACRRELEVNREVDSIYIGVTPVVRRDGRLRLGGPGDPVEWLVEMHRFDRRQELDRLCENGAITLSMVEALADRIAALHRAAATRMTCRRGSTRSRVRSRPRPAAGTSRPRSRRGDRQRRRPGRRRPG